MNKYLLSAAAVALLSAGIYSVAQESDAPEGQISTFPIAEFSPADGSAVKSIDFVKIGLVMEDPAQPMINMERISEITLTPASGDAIKAVECGEPEFKEPNVLFYPISFGETITEAGTYTVSVPEGVFYEAVWDNTASDFVNNGRVNEASTIVITVDSSIKSPIMNYTLHPASGSKMESLSGLVITFDSYGVADMIQVDESGCVISNGEKEFGCSISHDWSGDYSGKAFTVSFMDSDDYVEAITEEGEWTLTFPAGAFSYNNEVSDEITAVYTIGTVENPDYKWVYPSVDKMELPQNSVFTLEISCENATEISYEPAVENAAVTVKYAGKEVAKVENAMTEKGFSFGDNYGEGFVSFRVNGSVLGYGAILEVSAEEGAFTINGHPSPALHYMVSMVNNRSYEVTPENGSVVAMPAESDEAVNVTFSFMDLWDDPLNVSAEAYPIDDEIVGIRVSYNGESVSSASYTKSASEGNFVISIDKAVFAEPGKLVIDADEGAFTVEGKASPKIDYVCTFGEKKVYENIITPTPGKEVELKDLKEIKVEFPDAENVTVDEAKTYVIFYLPGTTYPTQSPSITAVEDAGHPAFIIHFEEVEEVAAPVGGMARLVIGRGTFNIDGVKSDDITASWDVLRNGEVDLSWVASPEKTIVNAGQGIYATFVFNEYETISLSSDFRDKAVVTFAGETIPSSECEFMCDGGFKLLLNLYEERFCDKSLTGELRVQIPEGCITVSGKVVPAIDFTWDVVEAKDYTYVFDPAAGSTVSSLSTITVEIPEAETGEVYNANGISLRASDYSSFNKPTSVEVVEGAAHATFRITFENAPTKNGEYVLSIFLGTFTLDGAYDSPTIDIIYNLDTNSGVEGVENASTVTVYTLGGVLLHKDAPASVLDTLKKGIYIVNGKKQSIR